MKKMFATLIAVLALYQLSYAQWSTGTGGIYYNSGTVAVGLTAPTTIYSSALLFPSAIPKMEIMTGTDTGAYSQLVVIRHSSLSPSAVPRQLGLVLKLSNEASGAETMKMGGMLLESSSIYANSSSLSLVTQNIRRLSIDYLGNIGIGTTYTYGYNFAVNGTAIATSMTVKLYANWPDYVFKPAYVLPKLTDIGTYINEHHHLPEMPSAEDVAKDGLNLGEMNKLLVKKVEELTLYLIQKDETEKRQREINKKQSEELKSQQDQIDKLRNQLESLIKEKIN